MHTLYKYISIKMYVLSKVIETIVKPLAHIFNLSFSSGIFPNDMKIAKIIPLFKNGRKTDFTNYRPISILSQFSKIMYCLTANTVLDLACLPLMQLWNC